MYQHIANFFVNSTGFFVAVALIVYSYFRWSFQYWERKGVPSLPARFPFGNADNPFWRKRTVGIIIRDNYNGFKAKGAKFGGTCFLTRPTFLPVDPEIVKRVLAKDFRYVRMGFLALNVLS